MDLLDSLLQEMVRIADSSCFPKDLREIDRVRRDTRILKELLAITRRVEGVGSGANCANSDAAQAANDPACLKELLQILAKARIRDCDGVVSRQRVLEPILAQVIADRDLAAECVAPPVQAKLIQVVRTSLHKDRHIHIGETN